MDSMLWKPSALRAIADAQEVDIAAEREDGTMRTPVTIWSIGVGDELYVRSWKGRGAGWFRHAIASEVGAISGGGVSQLVSFEGVDAAASMHAAIDAGYLSKYGHTEYAAAMNEPTAVAATLRVIPRA
jgi:hypothetical protein